MKWSHHGGPSNSTLFSETSERQDQALGKQGASSVKAFDDVQLPDLVQQVLALGPKHPASDNFFETHSRRYWLIFFGSQKSKRLSGGPL